MPALHQYFGTPLTTWILNRLYSSKFSDIHCGMRGITRDALGADGPALPVVGVRVGDGAQVRPHGPAHGRGAGDASSRTRRAGSAITSARAGSRPSRRRGSTCARCSSTAPDFFLLKPGLVLIAARAAPDAAAERRDRSTSGPSTLSLYWMLLGGRCVVVGLQTLLPRLHRADAVRLHGPSGQRWLPLFPYTRTVLVAVGSWCSGSPRPCRWSSLRRHDLALGRARRTPRTILAVLGLLLVSIGVLALHLHARAARTAGDREGGTCPSDAESIRDSSYGQHREPTVGRPVRRLAEQRAVRRHATFEGAPGRRLRLRLRRGFARVAARRRCNRPARGRRARRRPRAHTRGRGDRGAAPDGPTRRSSRRSLDVVLCLSVLEHLWEPRDGARDTPPCPGAGRRGAPERPDAGAASAFLELSAFRLGLSPAEEMDDHKAYYDPRDLWPMLVRAGFRPSEHPLSSPQVRPQHVRGLPRAPGRTARERVRRHYLRRDAEIVARARPRRDRAPSRRPGGGAASGTAGCSSSASAARRATPATRSTTSASSAASRPTRRPTTSPS